MKVAFVGGGNMASAIIGGLIATGRSAREFIVVEPNEAQRAALRDRFGVVTLPVADDSIRLAELIVIAVKPQQMREAAKALKPLPADATVMTIAAGIRLADLSRWLGGHTGLIRAMPNTPALIHQGITGLYAPPGVPDAARQAANSLMTAVGQTLWLADEALLDAVTAVSGSGPAYVFYAIEAVQAAGEKLGFSAQEARALTLQTFVGAAALAAQSADPPSVLRDRVTSKGGTTERALNTLEAADVKARIIDAVSAACDRSRELGAELGNEPGRDPAVKSESASC
ncbi:MAG: pyrroline-5-carboxylate reductase [Betaproteobacteria bacterium]|nr:pyrroline-5-carboxylate reductase [Betaproteobacteria bacterium]